MTTYTAITNGQIDQDSPITQPLMTLMRDNPIAIAEGADGAPRIVAPALQLVNSRGTAFRTTVGNNIITSISTSELSNLDDMALVLATGWLRVQPTGGSDNVRAQITYNIGASNVNIMDIESTGTGLQHCFSYLIALSSSTSVNLRMNVTSVTGNASADAQLIVLGR